ncbi:MAG TPA: hypothetical protein VK616_10660 [Flavitalea sp.]|nr:hypothetical protein [Flavitalea sp.]
MWRSRIGKMLICSVLIFGVCRSAFAQLKWDGEANDGLWTNAINWAGNILPGPDDEILMDNTFLSDYYEVSLGTGITVIKVRSIKISPSPGKTIQLIVPVTSTAAPALHCTGSVYGLILDPGAIFINASGAGAGATLEVSDSIRINNGGRFIHRTPRSHAANISVLSRDAGTEYGEFEFNIPVASTTISVSGQVFGRLRIVSGSGGTINYTGTGTNGLTVRSDLEIGVGVNLNFNLEGTLLIGRHLIQSGGMINLGSTARKLITLVKGNVHQASSAIITETGTANPEFILAGTINQEVDIQGNLLNDINFKIDNSAGVLLKHSLTLQHNLELKNGIVTTGENTLTLAPGCLLVKPANLKNSFVNGRLKKEGLVNEDFVFPVGRDGILRWMALKKATGNFSIEFFKSDPRLLGSNLSAGLAHISSLEFWSVHVTGANAQAEIELSFDNVNSGGVTDLSLLRIAKLKAGAWLNSGNTFTSGSPGSDGSVVSNTISEWTLSEPDVVTLASSAATQNPLPVVWQMILAKRINNAVLLEWKTDLPSASYYELIKSTDGSSYERTGIVFTKPYTSVYTFIDRQPTTGPGFYKVILVTNDSARLSSKVLSVEPLLKQEQGAFKVQSTEWELKFVFASNLESDYHLNIFDLSGRLIQQSFIQVTGNSATVEIRCKLLKYQFIIVHLIDALGKQRTLKVRVQ